MEPRIKEIASGLLKDLEPKKGLDMITDFSDPFPVTVIAEMLGIPVEDRKKFKRWSDNEIGIVRRICRVDRQCIENSRTTWPR